MSSPPSSPQFTDTSAISAELRLREAEDRLRDAIAELQRRQRRRVHPPCDHSDETSCVAHAIGNLCQSFLLSYGVRVGIGILLRAFKLARRQSYSSILDLKETWMLLVVVLIVGCFMSFCFDAVIYLFDFMSTGFPAFPEFWETRYWSSEIIVAFEIVVNVFASITKLREICLSVKILKYLYDYGLASLQSLVSEKDLIVREEACRIGLLFGGFTGSYHALRCLLRKLRKKETPLNAILAGSAAGLSILALDDPNRRRTLALYLLARVAQCAYNSAKSKNKFHFWGSHWQHGDSLLFALASAQVMYAFVMRPESLPKAYQDFIQKTGPVAKPVYKAVRDCCRGGPVDVGTLSAYLSDKKNANFVKLEEFPSIIPCSIIHPNTNSCLAHNAKATSATFKKTFPLYFSLTFVPFVMLRLQKFMEAPVGTSLTALKGAVRSTTFLSAFVGIFQGVICMHRKVASKDHKLVFWVAGAMSALSVLLEKKVRRGELALYVLPRAVDSWWYILVNRHLLPDIRNAEVALFSACMGAIMYYLEHEPDTMAPILRGLISRFLASRISNPDPPNRSASYAYLQTLDAMKKPALQDDKETEAATPAPEKYNLESIPGL